MAHAVEAYAARDAVLRAGNSHVRPDLGVPRWLAPATRARTVSIGMLEAARSLDASPYDTVISTPAQLRPNPCERLTMPEADG